MRPISLQLEGFTSFRERQELSFDGLDLFAICGPTGSGKSSILDAITYALFGRVERVGQQVGELVSLGQPRMAVTFEFAAGSDRYRVARTTTAGRRETRVLLERWVDGGWEQAGEGADRVREVNQAIERIIGLDYEGFTRAVLLPQGRFAEFLVGDATKRRRILSELLGLELFKRLARRAGELQREAASAVTAREDVMEREYAGVTLEALAEAETRAREAEERERVLAEAVGRVREVAARWARAIQEREELAALADELEGAAEEAGADAEVLDALAEELATVERSVREAAAAVRAAEREAERAGKERARFESVSGGAAELGRLRGEAEELLRARERRSGAEAEVVAAGEAVAAARALVEAAEAAVGPAEEAFAEAERRLREAEAALETARHADLVAAVRAGVRVGDPCPVCGAPIERLAAAPKARALAKAERDLERERGRHRRAQAALEAACRGRDQARLRLEAAEAELARAERSAAEALAEVERRETALAETFGRIPEDPVAAVDERLEALRGLVEAEERAREALEDPRAEHRAAEQERDALDRRVAELRGKLASAAWAPLLERARGRVRGVPATPPATTGEETVRALAKVAARWHDVLSLAAERVRAALGAGGADEGAYVEEATAALGGLVAVGPEARSVQAVRELAEDEQRAAARRTGEAHNEVRDLRRRLEDRARLEGELAELRARRARFEALAKELREDRIVAFLQQEALEVLAAAGSERLAALSGDRYRLVYEDDEFSVVDTWNGEERRPARTLSGGETFLASLALALALSEQVASLAVAGAARLDSLFLDEGFGTLDPEALEVVVEALEQLGGDGRLVGAITHVSELAARMPVRIVVEKSPRGSRVRVET